MVQVAGCTMLNPAFDDALSGAQMPQSTSMDETSEETTRGVSSSGGPVDSGPIDLSEGVGEDDAPGDTSTSSSGGAVEPTHVLLITSNAIEFDIDHSLALLLEEEGAIVELGDESVTGEDVVAMDLVVVSETVDAAPVQGKLRDIPVPMLIMEHEIWEPMHMGNPGGGIPNGQVQIEAMEPLETMWDGTVVTLLSPLNVNSSVVTLGPIPMGDPAGPTVVARALQRPHAPAIFAYEVDQSMQYGTVAPARRVGFGVDIDVSGPVQGNLSDDGLALVKAAVRWLVAG